MTALALALVPDAVPMFIYGRQSHGSNASIDQQLAAGRRRAEIEGWEVAAEYQDGISASRHASRDRDEWPKLLEAVAASSRGADPVVWLWESSRGDRRNDRWSALLASARDNGVRFCIENHGGRIYDMTVPRDWRTLSEDGVENEYESEQTSMRVLRDKEAQRLAGKLRGVLGGPPPVGYLDTKAGWETDPKHAAVLRDVAARVLAGEALHSAFKDQPVIRTNPAWGTEGGGKIVNEKMIRSALRRPGTAGLMTDRDGGLMDQVVAEPPLDRATWDALAAKFESTQRGRTVTGAYPLGKILKCGKCGNQLSGDKIGEARTPGYACKNAHKVGDRYNVPCRGVSIQAGQLHDLIRAALKEWAALPSTAAAVGNRAALGARQAELAGRIDQHQEMIADLGDKRYALSITAERYSRSLATLEAGLAALRAEAAQVAAAEAAPVTPDDAGATDWDELSGPGLHNAAALAFVTPIVIMPGRGGGRPLPAWERVKLTVRGE